MRKILSMALTASLLFMLASCGGSAESDAKKLAELQCKTMKNPTDTALQKEAQELSDKLKTKYSSEDDQKKFAEVYLKAIAECK
jgi:ABC-type phosphate/phosphonate transport system substrate-binding protein